MRSADLLKLAADALSDGVDPFNTSWLSANEVTLDECFSLAEQLAIGARIVAEGLQRPRSEQGIAMLLTMAASL